MSEAVITWQPCSCKKNDSHWQTWWKKRNKVLVWRFQSLYPTHFLTFISLNFNHILIHPLIFPLIITTKSESSTFKFRILIHTTTCVFFLPIHIIISHSNFQLYSYHMWVKLYTFSFQLSVCNIPIFYHIYNSQYLEIYLYIYERRQQF